MEDLSKQETCFIIMPYGGYFDDYYLKIYKPAIVESGLRSIRSDDMSTPGTIINDIWDNIQNSRIVLADLTGQNANVFYELGLAHASGKPVILLSESIDDIPFDLRALRVIIYNKNVSDWGALLKDSIKLATKDSLVSPLKTILPTFLTVTKDRDSYVSESDKILLEIKADLDSLKRKQEFNQFATNNKAYSDITLSTQEVEILKLLSKGEIQSVISKNLDIKLSEVEKSIIALKSKFNAKNNIHLLKILNDLNII